MFDDELGDLPRLASGYARENHRHVRRVVTVLGLPRCLPHELGRLGQSGRVERHFHSVCQPIRDPHPWNVSSRRFHRRCASAARRTYRDTNRRSWAAITVMILAGSSSGRRKSTSARAVNLGK